MKHGNNTQTAEFFAVYKEMQGSNLCSYGEDIFSYRTIIARHENGVTLLNCRDYSHTTQRHKLEIRRAAEEYIFEIPNICGPIGGDTTPAQRQENYQYLLSKADEMKEKASRARKEETRRFYTIAAAEKANTARMYKTIFAL